MSILVVGDFIIDRTWLVADLPLPKRFGSHYDIVPSTLVKPTNQTDAAGGVGTIARSIAATSDVPIVMASGWSDDVKPLALFPPDGMLDTGRITPIQIAGAPFTTLKSRVFTSEPEGPVLRGRYDRNLKTGDLWPLRPSLDQLPKPEDVGAVIVSDYDYGLFDIGEIVEKLEQYKGCRFILRSPHNDVIKKLPWTMLAINLRNLTSILGHEDEPFDEPVVRQHRGKPIYHPQFIAALAEIREQLLKDPGRAVLVRMSRDAAVLLEGDQVTPITLSIAHKEPDGVGAGDVVLAQMALLMIDEKSPAEAAVEAFERAAIFSAGARQLDRIDEWYTPKFDLEEGKTLVSPVASETESVAKLVSDKHNAKVYENLLNGPIRLHEATWYLPNFLTVNPRYGREIVSLKSQIRAYVERWRDGAVPDHPFLGALCGEPGAGKSTLAKALAEVVGCEVVIESVAQWTSAEDLFWLCERIRSIRMRKKFPLAFIDEVDTKVNGERIYGKLLAPVWDGAYFIHGEERNLGAAVFIMAGSTPEWQVRTALLDAAREKRDDKLPDLISRLTANPVEIPPLVERRADTVYLAANSFIRRFPRVRGIARGILRMFADSTCQHGSRSITRVVDLFGPLEVDHEVRTTDLRPARHAEFRLHIPEPLQHWERETAMVNVEI